MRNLGIGVFLPGIMVSLALLLSACGASLDSGVPTTSSSQTPATVAASPTPTPSASAAACTSPATAATYQLPGATVLAGNLQIKDTTVGTGATAKTGNKITVSYTGSLTDGTVFDSSAKDNNGKPVSFTLAAGKVIAGWVEGIPGMKVGGTRELVIPAALGYSCAAQGAIPANSTLIFTVQLLGVS
ncbi:MAG TPA: FKBP-type peptidyl-prolyl cis-trans isomerase [Candidatus Acidoferrales bacterium]|nr:FKBP-type peptidyl-prolyl cis-trans isomerase [Candidatus Acidoferrales bacterium]